MSHREQVVVDFEERLREENVAESAAQKSKHKQAMLQIHENNHQHQTPHSGENNVIKRPSSNPSFQRLPKKSQMSRKMSRLIDPPEESCGCSSESMSPPDYNDDDNDDDHHHHGHNKVEAAGKDVSKIFKRMMRSAFIAFQWFSLASIVSALACNLWVSHLKRVKLWGLALWEWEIMMLVLICGRLLSSLATKGVVFLLERNFILRKRVLYFVYGLKSSLNNSMWLGLVLLVWHFILSNTVKNKINNRILSYVTKILVCLFVGSLIWLLKTIIVKVFALSFHEKTFFKRIHQALFNHYVIETLSSAPSVEGDAEKAHLCGFVGASKKKQLHKNSTVGRVSEPSRSRSLSNDKKQQFEEITLDQLHKFKRKNISPCNMRSMINMIMHGAFTNLDDKILNYDIEYEPLLQIRCKCRAKKSAQKIFLNVAQPGSQYIYLEDLMRFMGEEEALKTMDQLRGSPSNKRISISSLTEWVLNAFRERRTLALSLKDTKTAVDELHCLLRVLVAIVILIVWLIILETPIIHLIALMSSQLLVAVFVFGNTCRAVFEAIIFLFLIHPFDVGDRCEVDGVQMMVEEMNILTTVFLKCDNQKVTYPNNVLATKPISNYQRSPDMGEVIDFCIHFSTPLDKVAAMKTRIIEYIEGKKEYWQAEAMVIIRDVEELNKLNMSVWVTHRMNYQDMRERWIRREQLIEEMIKVFKELHVEYRLLPLDVNLRNL